ncbi:MAG TPA: hypothetical protein VFM46_01105, partial [Pseudomonadales bacterium]|nr:hypothetical protein [Pseudomonadales bacterium]
NQLFCDRIAAQLQFKQVQRFQSLNQLEQQELSSPIDLLVIEDAAISAASCSNILQAAQKTRATHVQVIYRYGRERDLQQLRQHGLRTWQAPVNGEEMVQALQQSLAVEAEPPATTESIPPRQFSEDQLARLLQLNYRVECECPRHLSELISALGAFELYSNRCENRSPADARLHLEIYRRTAQARAIMEEVLAKVLQQEAIPLQSAIQTN